MNDPVLQSPEFLDKFNEITKGWKAASEMPDDANSERDAYLYATPFLQTGMNKATYVEFENTDVCDMEWGMQHKLCVYVLNNLHSFEYYEPYIDLYDEINAFVAEKKQEAYNFALEKLKARKQIALK